MSFPIVNSTSGAHINTVAVSHNLTLPAGIQSGDLLIALIGSGSAINQTINIQGSGWTELFFVGVASNRKYAKGFYRIADGTEGSSITVDLGTQHRLSYQIYRIINYNSNPEANAVYLGIDGSDPPALTPSWGAKDTLWIAGLIPTGSSGTPSAPSNYTDLTVQSGFSTVTVTARRELNASTENPSTFGGSYTNPVGFTLGVEGISDPSAPIKIQMMI